PELLRPPTSFPEYCFGTADVILDGVYNTPTILWPLFASLAKVAPQNLEGLMHFEWAISCGFIALGMVGYFVFARRAQVPLSIATAMAMSVPFVGPFFFEYRHAGPLRARETMPLILATVAVALTTKERFPWRWLLVAASLILCFAQTYHHYLI